MKKPHYAWVICSACLLLYACNLGLCSNIFTIYLPFIEATGISHSAGSAIISVRALFSFVTTCFVDAIYRRISLRKGLLIFTLIGASASLIMRIGGSAWIYYCGAAVAGVAYGAGSMYPAALLINKWFDTSKGLAMGICSAGSGLTTMLLAPAISSIAIRFGLKSAFLFQSGFMALCALLVFLAVKNDPADMGLTPYRGGKADRQVKRNRNAREIRRTTWALLAVTLFINGGVGLGFSGHLSILAVSSGYTQDAAALFVSMFGLVLIIGKLSAGSIADRIGAFRCSVLLIGSMVVGCVLTCGMDGVSIGWCYAIVLFFGFGGPVYNVSTALWASDLTDSAGYGKMMKWLQLFYNLGGIALSTIPGIIAERTGEYQTSYLLLGILMCVSMLTLWMSYKRQGLFARHR